MQQVELDKIIQAVTVEVVKQLKAAGVTVAVNPNTAGSAIAAALAPNAKGIRSKTERIDMSKYRTPVLTERHMDKLHVLTGKIIVPTGTIITPKARETAKRKQIIIEVQ